MNIAPFISICVLSYNRPETLKRLLQTIDTVHVNDIELVVCEDCSPRREEIRGVISEFSAKQLYSVRYFENAINLGYDKTFNRLVHLASGSWLIFMGDDDEFVPRAFDKMYGFLKEYADLGYVMKSHYLLHSGKRREKFRYFKATQFFQPGVDAYLKLFRRSVFIAGFTIRREYVVPYITDRFDGTMLMQLYMLAEVALKYPTAYFDEPFTQQYASHAHNSGEVMFDRENNIFVPRRPTLEISLKFLKSFVDIATYIDETHHVELTRSIQRDMSKYFYPSLSIHRDAGLAVFFRYVRELNKLGFNASTYYYIYVVMLIIFGRRICDWGIYSLKSILGYTPQL